MNLKRKENSPELPFAWHLFSARWSLEKESYACFEKTSFAQKPGKEPQDWSK